MTDQQMEQRALRKSTRRKIVSVLSFAAGGLLLLSGIFEPGTLSNVLPGVMIYSGIGMLFQAGSRSALEEAQRFAEFDYAEAKRREVAMDFKTYQQQHLSKPSTPAPLPIPEEPKNDPKRALEEYFNQDLSVLQQGMRFAHQINKANDLIPDAEITDDLNIICKYVNDIFAQAAKDKSIEHQIRKFSNIYLPQTLKLCNLYIDLQKKHVETSTIKDLKSQIAKSISNAKNAFANFNDNLMQQASVDIEAEIETFERILTIDGLLGRREIILPTREKEKEEA